MKMQLYTVLARRCQSGDVAARKKLLMESYMWISYQCRHILLNQTSAEMITRDILHTLHKKLDEMETPDDYFLRMQEMIAEKAAFWLAECSWGAEGQSAGKMITLPGKMLDETQTALFVMRLVDDLPALERLCVVLNGCGGMEPDAVSVSTGIPIETVVEAVERAEKTVHQQLEEYRNQKIRFLGLGSFDLMLTGAMESSRNEMTAAAVAESVMGTIRPKKIQSTSVKTVKKKPAGLITAIVILLIALVGLIVFALYLEWEHQDSWVLHAVPQFASRIQFFL